MNYCITAIGPPLPERFFFDVVHVLLLLRVAVYHSARARYSFSFDCIVVIGYERHFCSGTCIDIPQSYGPL